jgi:hypothetical protein
MLPRLQQARLRILLTATWQLSSHSHFHARMTFISVPSLLAGRSGDLFKDHALMMAECWCPCG